MHITMAVRMTTTRVPYEWLANGSEWVMEHSSRPTNQELLEDAGVQELENDM